MVKRFLEQLAGTIVILVGLLFLLLTGVLLGTADRDQIVWVIGIFGIPTVALFVVGIRLQRGRKTPVVDEPPDATTQPPSDAQPDPPPDNVIESSPIEDGESAETGETSRGGGYTCPGCGGALSRKASVSPKGDTKCEYCDRWFNIHEDSPPARSSQSRQSVSQSGSRANLVHCRDCGHQISRDARVCPSCGAPQQVQRRPDPAEVLREQQRQHRKLIALQEREAAEQKRKQNQESTKGCLGCLGFIFVVWLLSWIGNNAGDPPLQQSPEPMEQPGSDDSKPGLIAPGPVLNTLRGEGFEPGMWRQSHSVDGGWCCASLGNAIEFGAPGSSLIPLPSNLSLFVYGSGSEKLDRVVIKLNINNGETADQGKRRLWKTAAALLKSLDADASEELDAAIRNAPVRFLDGDVDIENKRLWQSEIPDATASLQLEQSRLTALVFTIRAADASSLWD